MPHLGLNLLNLEKTGFKFYVAPVIPAGSLRIILNLAIPFVEKGVAILIHPSLEAIFGNPRHAQPKVPTDRAYKVYDGLFWTSSLEWMGYLMDPSWLLLIVVSDCNYLCWVFIRVLGEGGGRRGEDQTGGGPGGCAAEESGE